MTIRVPREQWAAVAQPGELDWWLNKPWSGAQLDADTEKLWRGFGFTPDQFAGKTILSIGCGPTVHERWFKGAQLVCIDPLADEYRKLSWHNLGAAVAVHSFAAEVLIPELRGRADAVFSINALDHAYDFGACAWNIHAYLKPGALAFLSIDLHPTYGAAVHPLHMDRREAEAVYSGVGLLIDRHTEKLGAWLPVHGLERLGYGDGTAHSWWLTRE